MEEHNMRMASLLYLKRSLDDLETWLPVMQQAKTANAWFTIENQKQALKAIREAFLDQQKIEDFLEKYPNLGGAKKNVAIIIAGNIPLVGFHDFLMAYLAGHSMQLKLSHKDSILMEAIVEKLRTFDASNSETIKIVDRVKDMDAIIATGSSNSAKHFEYYFRDYPHIIRRNRNAIAVLDGNEGEGDLQALAKDINAYFGLGCRSVAKILVPEGYDFTRLLEIHEGSFEYHSKYHNNYDFNLATAILNNTAYLTNGKVLLMESDQITSRIACLHYSYYKSIAEVEVSLEAAADQIQCVVSNLDLKQKSVPFGAAQCPQIDSFADGVDTMEFLSNL